MLFLQRRKQVLARRSQYYTLLFNAYIQNTNLFISFYVGSRQNIVTPCYFLFPASFSPFFSLWQPTLFSVRRSPRELSSHHCRHAFRFRSPKHRQITANCYYPCLNFPMLRRSIPISLDANSYEFTPKTGPPTLNKVGGSVDAHSRIMVKPPFLTENFRLQVVELHL